MLDLDKVDIQIEQRQDELLDLLQELVRFRTPSPPARNANNIQQFIEAYLMDCSFVTNKWEVFMNDPNVVGVRKGSHSESHQSLILNGHVDVAEIDEQMQGWLRDPFDPHIQGGRIFGRGVADMKGGLAGVLFALKLLSEQNITIPGDIIFQSVIGEEVGEAGTLSCCQKGYTADSAVVVDTSDLHIQGQGGVITGWITVKSPQTYHDATRRNMIHAGGGLQAASAIENMVKIVQALQELERHWSVTKSYPGFPAGMNTINPAVIEGGRHVAFIADECRLWVTVHFYPDENHEQIAQEVEEYILKVAQADVWMAEHSPTFKWGGKSMIEDRGEIFPSLAIDEKSIGVNMLRQVHSQVFGAPTEVSMSPTVTDGGWLGEAGIPTLIYGPGDLNNAHAVNESLEIEQLIKFNQVMTRFIYEWCSTLKGAEQR